MHDNKMVNRASLLAAVALFYSMSAVSAANDSSNRIIVTATRTAQTVDDSLASVTVISREDIERSHSSTLMELLQSLTIGLDVSRNGGPGSKTSMFLRGTESDHVLVLIDGVRAASVTDGSFNWSNLSPDQVERIEIVRGPDSTLYGSDAIGGVIQIFTRKEQGLHAAITAGSFRTGKVNVGNGGQLGQAQVHINLSHEQDDGFSTTNDSSSNYEADNDGFRNDSITTGFTLPLGSHNKLGMNLFHSRGRSEYDDGSYANAYSDSVNSSGEMHLDWQTTEAWSQHFSINASQDTLTTHDSRASEIATHRRGANWQNDLVAGEEGLISLGLDAQQDSGKNTGTYGFDDKVSNRAGYLQYQWNGERFDLVLGGRRDAHSEYGTHDTGRLSLGSRVGDGRIYVSYATAFKAPTFNELFYQYYGNLALKPEESVSTELGYSQGGFRTSLYRTSIKNLIQYNMSTFLADNIGRAQIDGLELEYRKAVGQWQLRSAATLQKTEDRDSGDKLLRRADKKLQFSAHGPLNERSSIGIEATYTGPRLDYGDVWLNSYTLLNLSGEYRLARDWMVSGRIENLLDEDYQLVDGYNTAGLSAYLSLSYRQ